MSPLVWRAEFGSTVLGGRDVAAREHHGPNVIAAESARLPFGKAIEPPPAVSAGE